MAPAERDPMPTSFPVKNLPAISPRVMSLRNTLEDRQVRWAERNGIRIGAPPRNPASRATGYVSELQENLFDPLSERVKQQFIAGAGGELDAPDGQSGNMYAVYSSSALCVNLFHRWSRLLDERLPRLERLTQWPPGRLRPSGETRKEHRL